MADESTLRRLAFIRYLFRKGEEQAKQPEPLNAAAILTYHDSVELLLYLACQVHDLGPGRVDFPKYFDILEQKFPGQIADRKAILSLNDSRVALKHRFTLPSPAEIRSFGDKVASFFASNVPTLFGVSLAEVSLGHLVALPRARQAVLAADKAMAEHQLEEALNQLAIAFSVVVSAHRIKADNSLPPSSMNLPYSEDTYELRHLEGSLSGVLRQVQELQIEVGMLRYGVDPQRLEVFRVLTPWVSWGRDDEPVVMGRWRELEGLSDADVQFCYEFLIDAVLRIQESEAAVQPMLQRWRRY